MSLQIQHKIRQNAIQMRQYLTELHDWQQQMQLKEKTKENFKKSEKTKVPDAHAQATKQSQIRKPNKSQEISQQTKNQSLNAQKKVDLIRDANTIADYYNAWNKFDVDKVISTLEEEEQNRYKPYNPYEDSKNNLRAKPKTKVNISGLRAIVNDPTQLKDKGNLHFQSLEFEKAINCYTQCLKKLDEENIPFQNLNEEKKKLRCVVFSNRSMAYLKTQETLKALNDANESLKYNNKYPKSYYRRAECLKKLGKYKQALKDFKMVRALEPGENKAETEIKKIESFFAKRAKETKQSLLAEYNPNIMMGSRRIQITEVDQFEQQKKKEETNYLDQL